MTAAGQTWRARGLSLHPKRAAAGHVCSGVGWERAALRGGPAWRLQHAPPANPAAPSTLMFALGSAVTPARAAAAAVARARATPCAAVRAAAPLPALQRARFTPALARQSRRARVVTMASLSPQGAWRFDAAFAAGLRHAAAPRLVAALARGALRRAPPPTAPPAPRRCHHGRCAHARARACAFAPPQSPPLQPRPPALPTPSCSPRPATAARCTGSSRWATCRRRWSFMSARSA